MRLPKSKFSWCLRRGRRVGALAVRPPARRAGAGTAAYRRHGRAAPRELRAAHASGARGLADYAASDAHTSGLRLGALPATAGQKKGGGS